MREIWHLNPEWGRGSLLCLPWRCTNVWKKCFSSWNLPVQWNTISIFSSGVIQREGDLVTLCESSGDNLKNGFTSSECPSQAGAVESCSRTLESPAGSHWPPQPGAVNKSRASFPHFHPSLNSFVKMGGELPWGEELHPGRDAPCSGHHSWLQQCQSWQWSSSWTIQAWSSPLISVFARLEPACPFPILHVAFPGLWPGKTGAEGRAWNHLPSVHQHWWLSQPTLSLGGTPGGLAGTQFCCAH